MSPLRAWSALAALTLTTGALACSGSGTLASAGAGGSSAGGNSAGGSSSSRAASSSTRSSSSAGPTSSTASGSGAGGSGGAVSDGGAGGVTTAGGGGAGVGAGGSAASGGGGSSACVDVDNVTSRVIATADTAGEYALTLNATSESRTLWSQLGNEALVLDVSNEHGAIGQLVLHQGRDGLDYGMSIGHLEAGESVSVIVSPLSAPAATPRACIGAVKLTEAAALGAAGAGLTNAPIFLWPVQKSFDDLPVMLGWSQSKKSYEAYYTNENGGTVEQCGGGASGMQAEFARWGRGCDIEGMYNYGANPKTWERCTGTTDVNAHPLRFEGSHPIVYHGDGHNRLYESRGGYGQACGSGSPEQPDGDLAGWNTQNPGDDAAHDGPFVITLRPLPVALDPLGYATWGGRREGAVDTYTPWLYRITDSELARENKIDGVKVQPMQNYLFVDVHAYDVGGSGDSVCSFLSASGGFKLRVGIAGGASVASGQMTADYMGGEDAVKRLAIPLGQELQASDITSLTFDAYDNDGIYWLDLGTAFIPQLSGDNGATLSVVHAGMKPVNQYVDDDSSNCSNGKNPDGPSPPYPCAGSAFTLPLP